MAIPPSIVMQMQTYHDGQTDETNVGAGSQHMLHYLVGRISNRMRRLR